jgi:hypothetical protein
MTKRITFPYTYDKKGRIKRYRFFFHYRKCDGRMSVHFRNQCFPCSDVLCIAPCETKRNKRQPLLVMAGTCAKVTVDNGLAIIE